MPEMEIKRFNIKNRRYLGSKAKLLDFIHGVVDSECKEWNSFLDLFAGTGNVAWSFNEPNKKVILNDILEVNHLAFLTFFGRETIDADLIAKSISYYNSVTVKESNYFSDNFSDTFFSEMNCKKIGFIREDIEMQFKNHKINQRERALLITSLIYAMDKIANTVGHYDAFRMNGDLNRELVLELPELPDLKTNELNDIYKEDANTLVKHVEADVVYIDPPYNSRQYCDAYHLLENVALWNKPKVYGTARKMDRSSLKSDYCSKKAPLVFDELIQSIKAKYILVSYNNMGTKGAGRSQAKISDEDIISSLAKRGEVKVFETSFNQFTTGKTDISDHKERIFLCVIGDEVEPEIERSGNGFAKSPLNYTGGKFKLLPQLLSHFPYGDYTFIDLFGGGFNVGANVNYKNIIYNDKSKQVTRLIKLFKRFSAAQIIRKVEFLINKYELSNSLLNGYEFYGCESGNGLGSYNKKGYLKLRDDYNDSKDGVDRDYMLLTLVIFSFNNQIRFNSNEEYNMPIGKRDFNKSIRENVSNFYYALKDKNVLFFSKDFSKIRPEGHVNPFYYCDPPYILGTASYNESDGWTVSDEKRLLEFLKDIDSRGAKFALSNVLYHKGQEHKLLKQWSEENGYNIIQLKFNYNNSNDHKKDKKDKTIEVLVTNY